MDRSAPRRVRRGALGVVILFCIALVGAALLYLEDPAEGGLYPPCPFHAVTGLHCPGCGSLRGLHRLLHLDIAGALSMNPLMVAALPFVLYFLVSLARSVWTGEHFPGATLLSATGWWLVAAIVLFTILRNLPVEPFAWLAPG